MTVALAVAITAALIALFYVAGPVLKPLGKLNLVIFFVGVVAGTYASAFIASPVMLAVRPKVSAAPAGK